MRRLVLQLVQLDAGAVRAEVTAHKKERQPSNA